MFCKKCGNKLADGAKFCGVCGTVVQAQADPIPNTTPVDRDNVSYTIPLVREEKAAKAAAVTKGGKKSLPMKKLLLGVAALAVVVLVVVLISSLFGGRTVYLTTESISNSEVGKYTGEYVYDEDDCDCDCCCDDDDCDCCDDDCLEVECPACENTVCIGFDEIDDDGEAECPCCGAILEFEIEEEEEIEE